jgi:hypothetical protein
MYEWYSMLGLLVGVLFLVRGLIICGHPQASGDTMLLVQIGRFRLHLKTSTEGIAFAALGLLVILITRYPLV